MQETPLSEISINTSTKAQGRRLPLPLITVGFGGLQLVFSTFSGQGVVRVHIPVMGIDLKSSTKNPFYQSHLKSLGFSQTEVAITLLSGPICGALFQPGFGLLSDRWRSRWGRRRPFIVVGTINLVLSMLAVAWVEPVTRAIMPLNSELAISRNAVVVITELSIFSMFVAIQAVQVGLRALILDNCVPTEQPDASAWIARHINLAAFIAHLSAYLDLPQYIPGFHDTAFKDMTVLAVICLSVTMMITCLLISETSTLTFKALPASDGRSMKVRETWNLLLSAHSQIRLVFLVQFLAWLGWFPFLYYTVTYVNSLVSPSSDLTTKGKRPTMGTLTLLCYTAVSLFMSLFLPQLKSWVPSRLKSAYEPTLRSLTVSDLWVASHGVLGFCMLSTAWVTSASGTLVLFSLTGVSWAAATWIPYSLLDSEMVRLQECLTAGHNPYSGNGGNIRGLVYGAHNFAICLPQIIMTSLMGLMWTTTTRANETKNQSNELNVVWFLRLGGLSALTAMYVATWVQGGRSDEVEYTELI